MAINYINQYRTVDGKKTVYLKDDISGYTTNTGTVTSITAENGLTSSPNPITGIGTISANLKSVLKLSSDSVDVTEAPDRVYPVVLDKSGYLAVNVPWVEPPAVSYPVNSVNGQTGTVRLGYADVGAASSGHTHATTIATDSGINQLTMAANTKYKITAGDTSFVFTTPPDNNDTYESKSEASGGTAVSLVTTGEKYIWNNKADRDHVHTTTIATDSGTSSLDMVANTKYKITAGDTSFVFKTPPDNNTTYTHPTYTASSGTALYKIHVDGTGHVDTATAVEKADITALGIPAQDTTYSSLSASYGGEDLSLVTTGEKYIWNNKADRDHVHTTTIATDSGTNQLTMAANTKYKISAGGTSFVFTTPPDNNTVYTHPSYTASSGTALYKIHVDGTGHVDTATAVEKADITALGIPAQDTTYSSLSASYGGEDLSLVTTGEKYAWSNKLTLTTVSNYEHSSYSTSNHRFDEIKSVEPTMNVVESLSNLIDTRKKLETAIDDHAEWISGHNHDSSYLKLSGGTLTSTIISQNIEPSSDDSYVLGSSLKAYRNIIVSNVNGVSTGDFLTKSNISTSTSITSTGTYVVDAVELNPNSEGTIAGRLSHLEGKNTNYAILKQEGSNAIISRLPATFPYVSSQTFTRSATDGLYGSIYNDGWGLPNQSINLRITGLSFGSSTAYSYETKTLYSVGKIAKMFGEQGPGEQYTFSLLIGDDTNYPAVDIFYGQGSTTENVIVKYKTNTGSTTDFILVECI